MNLPGEGTEENPYKISRWEDFTLIKSKKESYYELVSNISYEKDIMESIEVFEGVIDGKNKTIFVEEKTSTEEDALTVGGFFTENKGIIKNITFRDISLKTRQSTGIVAGENKGIIKNVDVIESSIDSEGIIGGIAAQSSGKIIDCSFQGEIESETNVGGIVGWVGDGAEIIRCHVTADIEGDEFLGGIAGDNRGSIKESFTNCKIKSEISKVGGIAGKDSDSSKILNSKSKGSIECKNYNAGGIIGECRGLIKSCHSSCNVDGKERIGGICGKNIRGSIEDCDSDSKIVGEHVIGGIVGDNTSKVTDCYFNGDIKIVNKTPGIPALCGLVVAHNHVNGEVFNCYFCGNDETPIIGNGIGDSSNLGKEDSLPEIEKRIVARKI